MSSYKTLYIFVVGYYFKKLYEDDNDVGIAFTLNNTHSMYYST